MRGPPTHAKPTMDPQHREDAKSLLAAPPRVVNVGLELFATDLAGRLSSPSPLVGEGRGGGAGGLGTNVPDCATPTPDPSPQGGGEKKAHVVHVQWSPPAGGNAHLAELLGKLRS
jgi:hypothetical protein